MIYRITWHPIGETELQEAIVEEDDAVKAYFMLKKQKGDITIERMTRIDEDSIR